MLVIIIKQSATLNFVLFCRSNHLYRKAMKVLFIILFFTNVKETLLKMIMIKAGTAWTQLTCLMPGAEMPVLSSPGLLGER